MANAIPPGAEHDNFLAQVGDRLLQTVEDLTHHGDVATERLRLYLNSNGANLQPQAPVAVAEG